MKSRKSSDRSKSDAADGRQSERTAAHPASKLFPIVGIGASAGGLEAFTQLLGHLPQKTGMALVFIQHLTPKHESALPELLGRATRIPVCEVKEGMVVEPDRVYVIPPNTNMALQRNRLRLLPRTPAIQHLPIDYFLRSLAEEAGNRAIGVILSGTASDGALGLKAIKAGGGVTFAQDEHSAKYADMPRNAQSAGGVDFVLPPEAIARELVRIARLPFLPEPPRAEGQELPSDGEEDLHKIFAMLRTTAGVDFTFYKHTTIKRRIKRRMVLHKLHALKDYVTYLREHRLELDALYQDILIHVTGFFRDPEVFEELKKKVFPSLVKDRRPNVPIRIWVPGCSTGEEVYSIAISLLEVLGDSANATEIQIFGTDISGEALEAARSGLYMENVSADVSPDRLRRFFVKTPRGYQILKSIRDMCVFARQDAVKDPPFSRLDLISCRNLLIYLGTILQRRVIPIFHYALKPTGFLLLGTSETLGSFADNFTLVDKKHKIYAKKPGALRPALNFANVLPELGTGRLAALPGIEEPAKIFDVQKEADRILLAQFAPAAVIVNSHQEIVHFRGRTGPYLEPLPGQASFSLPKMAREGLLLELRAALQKSKRDDLPVRKERVQVRSDRGTREVDLEVIPVRGPSEAEPYFLILFQDSIPRAHAEIDKAGAKGAKFRAAIDKREKQEIRLLREELDRTRSTLRSSVEDQETTNEELKSANEEILSSNEELQSTNEELETAKEELQSTNEELNTLNEELQNRNLELSGANNDLLNLLASVNIPILMLGSDLRIRRFTPQAQRLLNLIPTDLGRPITDIKPNFNLPQLEELITEAIDTITIKEQEVQGNNSHWYSMQIRPYRTTENKLDGAVIAWIDITSLKASLEHVTAYAQSIVETAHESLLVLDQELRVKTVNRTFYKTFRVSPEETEGQFLYDLGNGQWNIPQLRTLLEQVVPRRGSVENFEVDHDFPQLGHRQMRLNARRIEQQGGETMILLAIDDISEMRRAEASLRDLSHRVASVQGEERQRLARELHDTTAGSLADLAASLAALRKSEDKLDAEARAALENARALTRECSRQVRTASYLLHPPLMRDVGLEAALRWYVEGFIERSGIPVEMEFPPDSEHLSQPLMMTIFRVVQESLSNIHRHSGSATASLRITRADHGMTVEVSDRGRGVPPGILDGDGRPSGKAGLGLRGIADRVQEADGRLEIRSGEVGTIVRATLPLAE
jgi:two-component system, chemotaxis family, CheB/CheR fusion protein